MHHLLTGILKNVGIESSREKGNHLFNVKNRPTNNTNFQQDSRILKASLSRNFTTKSVLCYGSK